MNMDTVLSGSTFLHALLLTLNVEPGYNQEYKFKIVDVHEISPVITIERFAEEEILHNPLHQLKVEERWNLCVGVKNYLSIKGMEPDGKIGFFKRGYQLFHIDGTREYVHALKCPTIPVTYPYNGKSDDENIMIPLVDKLLSRFTFERRVVEHMIVDEDFSEEKILESPLHKLTSEEQGRLCVGAKAFASASGLQSADSTPEKIARYKTICLGKTSRRDIIALPCPTSPPIYLSIAPRRPTVLQVISQVEFLDEGYTFSTEIITMAQKLQPDNEKWRTLLEQHYFLTLNGANRWHMCWAAHTYTHPKLWIIWSPRKSFDEVGLYEFQYEDGSTKKHVVVPCSTLRGDAMFLRSGNSENNFTLMIYGDKFLPRWSPLDEFY